MAERLILPTQVYPNSEDERVVGLGVIQKPRDARASRLLPRLHYHVTEKHGNFEDKIFHQK